MNMANEIDTAKADTKMLMMHKNIWLYAYFRHYVISNANNNNVQTL